MIVYFSGTGNSRYIAEALAQMLQEEAVDAGAWIRQGQRLALCSQRPWVIVAPIYCWRLPRVLEQLLRQSELQGAQEVYFVLTCGSESGNAAGYLKKMCRDKNWTYMGLQTVCMPENYIAMFDVPPQEQAQRMVHLGARIAQRTARRIAAGTMLPSEPISLGARLLSGPVNPLFYRIVVKDKAFFATDACAGCGKCVRDCVLNNIRLTDGKPRWQGNCTHCMACISGCPQQAIEYGKKSWGKRRYRCPPWDSAE